MSLCEQPLWFLGILHPLHTEQKAPPHHPLHPAHEAQPHPLFHQLQRDCTQVREHCDSSCEYLQLSARVASVFTLRLSSSGFSCWCSCSVESMPLSSRPASLLVTGRRRWRNSNKERSSCECVCARFWQKAPPCSCLFLELIFVIVTNEFLTELFWSWISGMSPLHDNEVTRTVASLIYALSNNNKQRNRWYDVSGF